MTSPPARTMALSGRRRQIVLGVLRSLAARAGLRAGEALATTVPLFLLLFASVYFVMTRASPASFSHPLTRTDTAQMILDLLALGLGIRVFIGAVQLARRRNKRPRRPLRRQLRSRHQAG